MVNIFGDRGKGGPQGERGPIGPPGSRGIPGPAGAVGGRGSRGIEGEKGDSGKDGSVGSRGIPGPAGAVGSRGSRGIKGEKGDSGKDGSVGSRGIPGPVGSVGSRGPRGQDGNPGAAGIDDMCKWLPNMVLKHLREEEEKCCLLLTNPEKDIKRKGDDIVEWISRSNTNFNAKPVDHPSKDIVRISDERFALDFNNSPYWTDGIVLSPDGYKNAYTYVCVTFRVQGSEEEQTIISNFDSDNPQLSFREITATNSEIRIWGVKNGELSYVTIQHVTREWTTLFVEWYTSPEINRGTYNINNNELTGEFTCQTPSMVEELKVSIGGRYDKTRLLTGAISALEIYSVEDSTTEDGMLPKPLKQLIIENQLILDRSKSPPPPQPLRIAELQKKRTDIIWRDGRGTEEETHHHHHQNVFQSRKKRRRLNLSQDEEEEIEEEPIRLLHLVT